ncbi:MAG: hypothetical protein O4861_11960 [Trichodesmium sp. St16_bin4-tuft]|nr:hypothetical protein [Trichodesmium sp. MAG_R01]MDE5099005.1 hypothetical protein [Trichodesmium sp. St16_bin4-tuft]
MELFFFIAIFENGFFGCIFVGYCLVAQSLAPGAVAGSQCALGLAIRNAQQYNFNVEKIVVSRFSTGIHLLLVLTIIALVMINSK